MARREYNLPSLGADMEKGTLVEWLVQVGDTVHRGDVVAVVETEKAELEIEIWEQGEIAELLIEPGDTVPVGTPIAVLHGEAESEETGETGQTGKVGHHTTPLTTPGPSESPESPSAPPGLLMNRPESTSTRKPVSPAARSLAKELGVDPERISGTGPGRAVTVRDVRQGAAEKSGPSPSSSESRDQAMRRAIASAMSRSKQEIPHYYMATRICMQGVLLRLESRNRDLSQDKRVLYPAVLLKGVAATAKAFGEMNGRFENGTFTAAEGVHIGMAVSLRRGGLIVPVLRSVDTKPVEAVMAELTDLVTRARTGRLTASELEGATISVTSLGERGVETVYGIIPPPLTALVGFGCLYDHPVLSGNTMTMVPHLTATLSADHRVSDGHQGGLFLRRLKEEVES
jgi:pyruvate dehydrogenase E2 component (dihydrolipoamide acetyltransferase)